MHILIGLGLIIGKRGQSKIGQEGQGAEVAIPRGYRLRPVGGAGVARCDPAAYAGHSLRSGFLTSAAEAGASMVQDDGGQPVTPLPHARGTDRHAARSHASHRSFEPVGMHPIESGPTSLPRICTASIPIMQDRD
jgi:hypothetical protein